MSNSTRLVPSVSEVLDKKNSKEELRIFNLDNTYNSVGISESFNEVEDVMVICAESGKKLFYTDKSGRKFMLNSFGFCAGNGKPYAAECLHMSSNVSISPFPVEYCGYYSNEEYSKPLNQEDLADIKTKYTI